MKRASIKERRAVADMIAIKAGRAARGPEDIEKAANMSDDEIFKYLKEEATPAGDLLQVEEIRPDDMPGDLFGLCMSLFEEFCGRFDLDKKNLSPLQWGAACSYVGRWFSSRSAFRVPSSNFIKGSNKKINAEAVADMLPVWADMCGLFNKVPLAHDFASFCGLSWDWIYKIEHDAQGVTPADVNLYKRLRTICRGGLDSRLLDPKGAPVGAIFYAKAKEGYTETQTIRHEYEKNDGGAGLLPDFGGFEEITDKSAENDTF